MQMGANSIAWSLHDEKRFEQVLIENWSAIDRLAKVAAALPHRPSTQIEEKFRQLQEDINGIETGVIPVPDYPGELGGPAPPLLAQAAKKGKNGSTDAERRKGVPWTEEEHRLFLMGLAKFGKGDWRSISRNFVVTRTPTQVASHAQKYFIRLNSMNKKDKRRSSIHDITTVTPSPVDITGMMAPGMSNMGPQGAMQGSGMGVQGPMQGQQLMQTVAGPMANMQMPGMQPMGMQPARPAGQ